MHQNWKRDYDPTTGRYIQPDPLGLIDGSSIYGYAWQNPGRWTDPTGQIIPAVVGAVEGCFAIPACAAGIVAILGAGVATQQADSSSESTSSGQDQDRSEKAAKARERKAYKTFCSKPPKPTGDYCADKKAKLDWQEQCLAMRKAFGSKYYGNNSHEVENENLQTGIDRLREQLKNECPEYCEPE